jgi:two-component system response regulator HydG
MKKILIIDDDIDMCLLLKLFLMRKGFETIEKHSGTEALNFLAHSQVDLIISDLMLGDITGFELLEKVKEKDNSLPFIIITAYEDVLTSVNAIKYGAFDYVTKPILPEEIFVIIQRAFELKEKDTKIILKNNFTGANIGKNILINTEFWKKIIKQINLIAPTDHNIIIYGETGSGKKVVAKEIHEQSKRKTMPLVIVNCGALSKGFDELISKIETANGGTLFLDHIINLPLDMQEHLIKIIKAKRIKSFESGKMLDLDVRIIASSNELLWNAVFNGRFKESLFHHINNFDVEVLSLRNLKDDILLFADYFLKLENQKLQKNINGFTTESETILKNYKWPGNLRELQNVITRTALLCTNRFTQIEHVMFPEEIRSYLS